MSANDANERVVGASVTDVATWATVTDAVALSEPDVAVITAVPSATEVTRPAEETVATDATDVVHVTVAPDIVLSLASFTVAVRVAVSPSEAKLTVVGDSVIEAATWVTVTDVVAANEPNVAVTVAEPSATAVTRPAEDTVATDAVDVVHETVTPDISVSPESFTVAVSVAVSASEAKLTLVGDTVIDEAP